MQEMARVGPSARNMIILDTWGVYEIVSAFIVASKWSHFESGNFASAFGLGHFYNLDVEILSNFVCD